MCVVYVCVLCVYVCVRVCVSERHTTEATLQTGGKGGMPPTLRTLLAMRWPGQARTPMEKGWKPGTLNGWPRNLACAKVWGSGQRVGSRWMNHMLQNRQFVPNCGQ